jgi:hypothetical protein
LNFLHDPPPPDQRRYMQSYAKLIAKHLDTVVMQSVPGTCTVPILRIQHYIVSDASIPPGPGLSEPRTESSHAHSRMCVLYGDEVMNTGHGGGGGGWEDATLPGRGRRPGQGHSQPSSCRVAANGHHGRDWGRGRSKPPCSRDPVIRS